MNNRKYQNALKNYTGFRGTQTIGHIMDNIKQAWPGAEDKLSGSQYGKVMEVANFSYHNGKSENIIDIGDFGSPTDFIAGFRGWKDIIEVNGDTITIKLNYNQDDEIVKTYKIEANKD